MWCRGIEQARERCARPARARPVTLRGGRPSALGLELNVDYVAAVALDLAGTVRARAAPARWDRLGRRAGRAGGDRRDLADDLSAGGLLVGATVRVPGLVGGTTGRWSGRRTSTSPAPGRDGVDAAFGWTGRRRVSNDADCAAFAETHHGAGATPHLLYLTGTVGIGAGIVERRRLVRGARGFAGEVGHMPVGDPTRVCGCGRTGCWEASDRPARDARGGRACRSPAPRWSPRVAVAARAASERRASGPGCVVGHYVGRGLAVADRHARPRRVVLGGYFVPLGDLVLEPAATLDARLASTRAAAARTSGSARSGSSGRARGRRARPGAALFGGAVELYGLAASA